MIVGLALFLRFYEIEFIVVSMLIYVVPFQGAFEDVRGGVAVSVPEHNDDAEHGVVEELLHKDDDA